MRKERGNKESWLAVTLSWLVPGIGQIYIGSYLRGILFATFYGLLHVCLVASFMWTRCPVFVSGIILLSIVLLLVSACIDAFKLAKKSNVDEFVETRKETKDVWLAIFLSLFLPGLGYVYLGKYLTFVLCLCLFFTFCTLFENLLLQVVIIWCVFRALISIHTGLLLRDIRAQKKRTLILFVALLTIITLVSKFLMPNVIKHQIVSIYPTLGPSMEPTILSGDMLLVNRLAYTWYEPAIGEIVLICAPTKESQKTTERQIVKRVFAVGGETVLFKDGKFVVARPDDKMDTNSNDKLVSMSGERPTNNEGSETIGWSYKIPEGRYFVMGDNRSESVDSRTLGAVHGSMIVGKVVKIVWPPSRIRTLKTRPEEQQRR